VQTIKVDPNCPLAEFRVAVYEPGKQRAQWLTTGGTTTGVLFTNHYPIGSYAEWERFSAWIIRLRKANPGFRFEPRPFPSGQRMYLPRMKAMQSKGAA
jgi:hypothetical protein